MVVHKLKVTWRATFKYSRSIHLNTTRCRERFPGELKASSRRESISKRKYSLKARVISHSKRIQPGREPGMTLKMKVSSEGVKSQFVNFLFKAREPHLVEGKYLHLRGTDRHFLYLLLSNKDPPPQKKKIEQVLTKFFPRPKNSKISSFF